MCVCVCIYWASRNEKSEVFFVYAEQSKAQGIHKMPVSKPHCSCQKLLFQLQREKGSSNKKKKSENTRTKKKWESSFSRKGKGGADVPYDEQHASRKPGRSAQTILSFSLLPRFPPRFACNFFSTAKSRCTTDMRCQSLQLSCKKTRCFFFFLLLQNFKSQEHASSKVLAKKEEKQKRQHKALNLTQNKKGGKKRRLIVESLRRKRPGKKKRYS